MAAFAAVVIYSHIYGLGRARGQDGTAARWTWATSWLTLRRDRPNRPAMARLAQFFAGLTLIGPGVTEAQTSRAWMTEPVLHMLVGVARAPMPGLQGRQRSETGDGARVRQAWERRGSYRLPSKSRGCIPSLGSFTP